MSALSLQLGSGSGLFKGGQVMSLPGDFPLATGETWAVGWKEREDPANSMSIALSSS